MFAVKSTMPDFSASSEANFVHAYLEGANIQGAFFDSLTSLHQCTFCDTKYGAVALADVHWGDANIAVVNWS